MSKALSILFGAASTIACSWALGRMLLKRIPNNFSREEYNLFAYLSGSALFSLIVFAAAAAQIVYDPVFAALTLAILLLAWRDGAFRKLSLDLLPPLPRLWRYTFWPVYAVFAAVLVICAMAPEMSPDGSSYHLGIIGLYYRHHGMFRITTNMYASLSQGLEMLFLNAWIFGRHSAAALVHCSFLLAVPLRFLRFGQRFQAPAPAAAAGLFFLCSPIAMIDGTSAYNDIAVACLLFAIFYLAELDAPPVLAGLLAGFAFAVKYTAFLGLVYLLVRYALRRRWRAALLAALAAAPSILPWLLRNYLLYRNPFSPLFNRFFPNPYVNLSFEQDYVELMRRYPDIQGWWQIPLDLTISGRLLGGFLGPLFLLTPLAIFALRKPLGRRALAAALLFASVYSTNIGTRFLIPALPFASLSLALALPAPVLPLLAVAHAVSSFPDIPSTWSKALGREEPGWHLTEIPIRPALRLESEDSWLSRKFPGYTAARLIEWYTPPGSLVFSDAPIPESYTTRTVAASFQSARNERVADLLRVALYPEMRPVAANEFKFSAQPLTAVRVVQTSNLAPSVPQSNDIWSIAEFRLFHGQNELRRAPQWRIDSRPNPWGIQYAFDNWLLTRWRACARVRYGQFVEVDFHRTETLDRIRLEMSVDQYGVNMQAEGRSPNGQWHVLSKEPATSGQPIPLDLRRLVTAELKLNGFTHVLTFEHDAFGADFREHTALWNVRELAAREGFHIYKLE
ncbi:MAG: hypothetical protein HY821_05475 [Acidobacteria bacterium]|nr:hypothetical protein [Acidobacteriota bacterium]